MRFVLLDRIDHLDWMSPATKTQALAKLNAHLKELDPKSYAADQDAKFLKASFDATRYTYEDDLANRPKAAPKSRRELDRRIVPVRTS